MAKYTATKKRRPVEKHRKMRKTELAAICTREFDQAQLLLSQIQIERLVSLNSYNQEPFGNEEDGLSTFISSDVRDTIEWMMPQLVDVFVGGDTPVVFTPENEKDVEAADIESRYCQYVFERQNNGVLLAMTWFKDALLQKNGIVKCWWDESENIEREEYKNKTGQEYVALQNDDEFEIDGCTIELGGREYSEEEYAKIIKAIPSKGPAFEKDALYHIIGYRTRKVGQVKIENVPPENFLIQKDHNSVDIKDARYCCELEEKTRSDLIEEGYDEDLVYSLPAGNIAAMMTDERWNRYKKEGGLPTISTDSVGDKSREVVTLFNHYIRADFNGDGVAELRYVRTAGKTAEFTLENEEVDRSIYHAITPYLNSYKFHGRSVADNMMDLQRARSQIWRNIYDNVMYSTVSRKIISGTVDIDALLSYVPGGIITKNADATIENEGVEFVANEMFPILQGIDAMRSERTGFSKETMGLDPSALAQATSPVGMAILSQSQLLVKMIATVFANTGFKSMMEHIRELALKNERKEAMFDLTGQFLQADPRSWRKKRDCTAKVGIGFAGKNEELSTMNALIALQQQFVEAQQGIEGPLTNATTIHNTVVRLVKRMGIKDPNNYFPDPATYKPPAPKPSLAEVQLKANVENMGNQQKLREAELATRKQETDNKHALDFAKLSQDERLAMARIQSEETMRREELLYKYGKDAHDRGEKDLDRTYEQANQKTKVKNAKHDSAAAR